MTTRVIRGLIAFLAVAVLAAGAMACGDDDDEAAGSSGGGGGDGGGTQTLSASNPTPLKVGIIQIANMAPINLAAREGIFEEEGLEVEIVDIGSADPMALLQAGEIDVALEIAASGLRAIQSGVDAVVIYQGHTPQESPPDSGGIVVQADGDVKTFADLKGKTVAVNSLHSQEVVSAERVLEEEGGLAKGDYQEVEVPFPNMPDALAQGQVAAAIMEDPFTTQSIESGEGRALGWNYIQALPGQPIAVFLAMRDWAADNPAVVEAFEKGMDEAASQHKADRQFAVDKIAEYFELPRELLADMPIPNWNNDIDPERWQALVDMMVDAGEMEPIDPMEHMSENLTAGAGN
jgi:NitT/TauT family transport system substrate-binding protein